MRKWLRRLRGALGIGTIWGLAGTVVGALTGVAVGVLSGHGAFGYLVPMLGAYTGTLGFLLGTGFAAAVTLLEERGALGELSPGRAGIVGGLAGAALPFAWLLFPFGEMLTDLTALPLGEFGVALVISAASCAALGGSLGAGTVALARRAPPELDRAVDRDAVTAEAVPE